MSTRQKKSPADFVPVNDEQERKNLLRQGVKSFASTVIWTNQQKHMIYSHLSSMIEGGKLACLFCWLPKDFDVKKFTGDLNDLPKPACYFSVALSSAHVFFRTNFLEIDPSEGLRFEIPQEIFKVQRRKDFRLPIPDGYLIKLEFPDPVFPENKIEKRIFDVSGGGLSFIIEHSEEAIFQEGQIIKGMVFRIRGRSILVDGEIRYLKPLLFHARVKGIKVGIQFVSINRKDVEFIRNYVLEESRRYFSKFY